MGGAGLVGVIKWWVWSIPLAVALKEYKRMYENILAVEKKLDCAKKHLV